MSRYIRFLAAAILTVAMWWNPAYAQRQNLPPAQTGTRKPVIEYIVVVILLAVPIGLVCRSSRRTTYGH